ncbi:type II toxin-antitoxin system RelE/ParE family toxin [Desulfosarcina variabilis]|uniref:type II toxin-antitoxin system RelE/ParE family toxin n=1 Tax=Desulfosarcina variabilis TaxID=2300 RepID=UPI003AFA3DD8
MPLFRLTAKAVDDMKSIGRFTERKWGREQRNRYLAMLDSSFNTIAYQPEIGTACGYIKKGYRKYHVGRHLIFYRQENQDIEIIRILHDSMDIETHF